MKWATSIAVDTDWRSAVESVSVRVRAGLGECPADLLFAFVSPHFRAAYGEIEGIVRQTIPGGIFCGASAIGVIGGGREVEQAPAVSLSGAFLPGVAVRPRYTDTVDLPDEDASPSVWRDWLNLRDEDGPFHFIVLADPFSAATVSFLAGLDYAFPDATKIGGLASGAGQARENALFLDQQVYREGLLAVALGGNLRVDSIVSPGCRPVGEPLTVTCCNDNLVLEVSGAPPVRYLESLLPKLDAHDRTLLETSLCIGLETDPLQARPSHGDFLIRNLLGVDQESGAVAVGVPLHEGQVVQFHLRDKRAAAEDLDRRLRRYRGQAPPDPAAGALLFSCLGRGENLYGVADHDTRLFRRCLGEVPLGGFFANGEIGPVGPSTYIHGYTSAFGLFRPG